MLRPLDPLFDLFFVPKSSIRGKGLVHALLAVRIAQGVVFADVEKLCSKKDQLFFFFLFMVLVKPFADLYKCESPADEGWG